MVLHERNLPTASKPRTTTARVTEIDWMVQLAQAQFRYEELDFPGEDEFLAWFENEIERGNGCVEIKYRRSLALPDSLGSFSSLQSLQVVDNFQLRTLPKTIGQLRNLRELVIRNCSRFEGLPHTIGDLKSLQILRVESCRLHTLPTTIGRLQSLEELTIKYESIVTLPDSIGSLKALKTLTVSCPQNQSLPSTIGELRSLQHLEVSSHLPSRHELRNVQPVFAVTRRPLPNTIGNLKSLRSFKLRSCPVLSALPTTIGALHCLEMLEICDCSSLSVISDEIGNLKSLQTLQLQSLERLRYLPPTLDKLQNLRSFMIVKCGVVDLPDGIGLLTSLENLCISNCPELTSLPDSIGGLKNLQDLSMCHCPLLESLPKNICECCNLQSLSISECRAFKELPTPNQNLRRLRLIRCQSLLELPESLDRLIKLKSMTLSGCGIDDDFEKVIATTLPPRLRVFEFGTPYREQAILRRRFPTRHLGHSSTLLSADALPRFLSKNMYLMRVRGDVLVPQQEDEEILAMNRFRRFLPGGDYTIPWAEFALVLELVNTNLEGNPPAKALVLYSLLRYQAEWMRG